MATQASVPLEFLHIIKSNIFMIESKISINFNHPFKYPFTSTVNYPEERGHLLNLIF